MPLSLNLGAFDFARGQPFRPPLEPPDGGEGEDIGLGGEEYEDYLPEVGTPFAYGVTTDINALYEDLSTTANTYLRQGQLVPAELTKMQQFLLGKIEEEARRGRTRADIAAEAGKGETRTDARTLATIAAANARSAASIGAANARNAASLAAQFERMVVEEGLKTERRWGELEFGKEERLAEEQFKAQQNALDREISRLQAEIALGNLSVNAALGAMQKWLDAQQYTLPEGAEYVPGFQPGGPVSQTYGMIGSPYNPEQYRARPVPFNPAEMVQQTLRGTTYQGGA